MTVSGSGTGSFAYDADGNRVWQTVGGVETHYVWDWVESGVNYYYFGGRKVAMRTGSVTYLCGDHLTSTVETNDNNANPSQLYYPYGAERRSGSLPTPYRYTGQRWESAIGLYFYNARWYDPALGRFIQPDTIVPEPGNPQALNRYSYCLNNPVKYTDPSGHYYLQEDVGDPVYYARSLGRVSATFESPYASELRKQALQTTATILDAQVTNHLEEVIAGNSAENAGPTAAQAMLAVVRQGARLSRNQTNVFHDDVTAVLCGQEYTRDNLRAMQPNWDQGPYEVRIEGSLGLKGWLRDPAPDNPQVRHFWTYVEAGYEFGLMIGQTGNLYHELGEPILGMSRIHAKTGTYAWSEFSASGSSFQDYFLGFYGNLLGNMLRHGMKPNNVSEWLQQHVMS